MVSRTRQIYLLDRCKSSMRLRQLEAQSRPRSKASRGNCEQLSSVKGFFTTRYAWTDSNLKAESLALEMVVQELKELTPGIGAEDL